MTPTITIERPARAAADWPPASAPSNALPPPVERFVDLTRDGRVGGIETIELTCDAWMRRPWWMPIPLQVRMSHRLGISFVHEIRIGRGGLSRPVGLDAFVDGRGAMIVGRSIQTGPTFDQGARIAMWGEALIFPASWIGRSDVGWESVDAHVARFVVASPEGDLPILVSFDRGTGLPASCAADRFKGQGPLTRWYGSWSDWTIGGEGVLAPRRMEVRWADEPHPWLTIRVMHLAVGVPVDETFERARAAIRAHR